MHTTKQVAEILGLDLRYTRRLIQAGRIKATKITSRLWLVSDSDLAAYQTDHPRSKAGRPKTNNKA